MTDAIEVAHRHLESWMSRDYEAIAATSTLPFVQYTEDGDALWFRAKEELPAFSDSPPFEVAMEECEIVVSGPTVTVVKLAFRWTDLDRGVSSVGDAVWGLARDDATFRVAWRQFVGWRND